MTIGGLTTKAMRTLGEDRVRYVLVSFVALGVDTLITLSLTSAHMPPAICAAVGYIVGLGLHWMLSSRFVFADGLGDSRAARAKQAALFFASGFGGLAVTVAVFTTAVTLGAHALFAKAISVGVSFCVVYLIRRHLIFPQRS